jgi:hypothetical protein
MQRLPWQQPLGHVEGVHVAVTLHWPPLQVPLEHGAHDTAPVPQAVLFWFAKSMQRAPTQQPVHCVVLPGHTEPAEPPPDEPPPAEPPPAEPPPVEPPPEAPPPEEPPPAEPPPEVPPPEVPPPEVPPPAELPPEVPPPAELPPAELPPAEPPPAELPPAEPPASPPPTVESPPAELPAIPPAVAVFVHIPSAQTAMPEQLRHMSPFRPHAESFTPTLQTSSESQHPMQLLGPHSVGWTNELHPATANHSAKVKVMRRVRIMHFPTDWRERRLGSIGRETACVLGSRALSTNICFLRRTRPVQRSTLDPELR